MTTVAKGMKRPPTKTAAVKMPAPKVVAAKPVVLAKTPVPKAIAPQKTVAPKIAEPKAIEPKVAVPKVVAPKPVTPKPMAAKVVAPKAVVPKVPARGGYDLDEQVGFRLRRAHQRASEIFNDVMGRFDVTPTQFAALAKLDDLGIVSQNQLGRATAMDPSTILGVVGRLVRQGHMRTRPDPLDGRQMLLELTPDGKTQVAAMKAVAATVSKRTLNPLQPEEAETLLRLLSKIG